jgi:hypothetical protein
MSNSGRRFSPRRLPLLTLAVSCLGSALLSYIACQAQAGMFCQKQSDCSIGLVCNKSPSANSPSSFGVCEPALRGQGETCLRTADCQTGLVCSNELGMFNTDQRHGICQAGASDLSAPSAADMAAPADLTPPSDLLQVPAG